MNDNGWVVVAKVGESDAAKRTDSCGDMEQLELMELILVSNHDTNDEAERAAAERLANKDGWLYVAMSRRDYEAGKESAASRAA
jgi:hypothetical protein